MPVSSGYCTEGTGSSTQAIQSMEEAPPPTASDSDPVVVEAGETVVYSVQRSGMSELYVHAICVDCNVYVYSLYIVTSCSFL